LRCKGEAMEGMIRQGDREARFMGKITAGMTHEIRNVLAILRESAGLMEDLMGLPASQSFPHRERLLRALGVIQQQVERAVELVGRLNRFAHSMDECSSRVDLRELLEQMCALAARQARSRKVELRPRAEKEGIRVQADPFALGMLISACMEHCMEVLEQGGVLELVAKEDAGSPAVIIEGFSGQGCGEEKIGLPPELACFSDLVSSLGLQACHEHAPGGRRVRLLFGAG
jgi:signal transduction histidine kinase